jgi:hypothetical protein
VSAKLPPRGLKAFLLRANEPAGHTFSRTPSFAWKPVRSAVRYEFELATSKRFSDNSIVYTDSTLTSPVASIPISLPWSTGDSYSLYAHVRALTRKGTTSWSVPYGFSMRWTSVPTPLAPSYPGLLRWTTVPGANAYTVWLLDANKQFTTLSNVADEREYYTFHQDALWTGTVNWRVRAVRWLYGSTSNGIPAVSYGPWSPVYTSYNPPFAVGPMTANATISDTTTSNALEPRAHQLMPAFLYSGNQSVSGQTEELYHVYVFTDKDCLNMVFRGALVGSPAYAPRPTGPLALPNDTTGITAARTKYLSSGDEGSVYTYEGIRVITTEAGSSTGGVSAGGQSSTGGTAGAGSSLPIGQLVTGAKVDLWDVDWPNGRYYWTVIPVRSVASEGVFTTLSQPVSAGATTLRVGDASGFAPGDLLAVGDSGTSENVLVQTISGNTITLAGGVKSFHPAGDPVGLPAGATDYRDTELTQDACASGRVLTFGKSSAPVVTGTKAPYVSGLSPNGYLFSAKRSRPAVYGTPLITWQPALGADQYEVQWSKKLYPWRTAGTKQTAGTALTLPLSPGTWFYRVRGLNMSVAGNKPQMSWSDPVALRIARPRFRVVG